MACGGERRREAGSSCRCERRICGGLRRQAVLIQTFPAVSKNRFKIFPFPFSAMNDAQELFPASAHNRDKPPGKIGGCVGTFLQLFDWNPRKRLFSTKRLPAGELLLLPSLALVNVKTISSLQLAERNDSSLYVSFCFNSWRAGSLCYVTTAASVSPSILSEQLQLVYLKHLDVVMCTLL